MSVEQRTNIKFCVKLGKTATETFNMLLEVYGDSCMSRTRVFEWHKRFVDGQLSVEDDAKPGRPCSVKTDVNIEKVRELVRTDRHLTIRMMADQLGIDKKLVRSILVDNLGMRKVCAKMDQNPTPGFCTTTMPQHMQPSVSGSSWPPNRSPFLTTLLIRQTWLRVIIFYFRSWKGQSRGLVLKEWRISSPMWRHFWRESRRRTLPNVFRRGEGGWRSALKSKGITLKEIISVLCSNF